MIIDEAKIYLKAGDGGDGGVYFLHEKFMPKGGPDGGDGGDGGDVVFRASRHEHDLSKYARQRKFLAPDGEKGKPKLCHGKNGQDLILDLPLGTQIFNGDKLISDMLIDQDEFRIAKGGNGGWGNQHFATSVKQTPQWAKEGLPGQEFSNIRLELKMIADVGLVGLPNAGKSTLLSVVSNAKPRIADYPFTTLEPNLGVVRTKNRSIIVADIPGLIEGASFGRGLGTKFLKHIERTRLIVQLIDASSSDTWKDYKTVETELKRFSEKLANKPRLIVFSKTELVSTAEVKKLIALFGRHKVNVTAISAVTHAGIDILIYDIIKQIS